MGQVYTANLNETKELVVQSQFSLGTSESEADERYLLLQVRVNLCDDPYPHPHCVYPVRIILVSSQNTLLK